MIFGYCFKFICEDGVGNKLLFGFFGDGWVYGLYVGWCVGYVSIRYVLEIGSGWDLYIICKFWCYFFV